ncbi:MAG: MarR family winged helix-turn-helix transcriptional regulator [Candidatus Saccharimonadales bacterium]
MNQRVDDVLRGYGMARSQFQALFWLERSSPLTQKELLGKMNIEPATLSGLIDTLEAKGYARRKPSNNDKRSKLIELTAAGKAVVERIPHPGLIVESVMFKDFSERDKQAYRQIVEKIIDNLSEGGKQ